VSSFTNDAGYLTAEVDGSTTNEIQTLSISNDTITLSNGGAVKLPTAVSGFDGQYTSLTGAPTNVSSFTNDAGYLTTFTEVDGSITNELQTISKSGNTVTLSNGGGSFTDKDTKLNETQVDNYVANNGYLTTEVDGSTTNEIQTLSISNDTISLSNGGGVVKLPSGGSSSLWTAAGSDIERTTGTVRIGPSNSSWVVDQFQVQSNNSVYPFWSSGFFRTNGTIAGVNRGIVARSLGSNSGTNVGMEVSASNATINYAIHTTLGDVLIDEKLRVGGSSSSSEATINATNTQKGIFGHSSAQHSNNWENYGVKGDVNTASNPGRGVVGTAIGANYGMAVRGEASTDAENQGVSGIALSAPGNSINQFGVYGEARKGWSATNSGTGTHWGGYFTSTGEGTYTIGAAGIANTPGTGSNRGLEGSANSVTASHNIGTAGYATAASASTNYGVYGHAQNGTGTNYGVQGYSSGAGTNQTGVYGYSIGTSNFNIGVDGTTEATGSENIGVGGYAYGTNTGGNKNYGVYAYAQNADTNYGVYSKLSGANTANYGIHSTVSGGTGDNLAVYALNKATKGGVSILGISEGVSSNVNWAISGRALGSSVQNAGVFGSAWGTGTHEIGLQGSSAGAGTYGYGVYGASTGSTTNYAGYFAGNVTITGNLSVTGNISKGSGTFKIDHPLDPENKYLVHSFVESPEMMNVYSGNISTDANGFATVELPDYFEAANKDFRYQLTVIGSFAQAIIKEKISSNKFVVQTNNPNVEVSWQVTAVRADKYAEANRIQPEVEKTEKGTYLHPEIYGLPVEKSENAESLELIHSPEEEMGHGASNSSSSVQKLIDEKKKAKVLKKSPQVRRESKQKATSAKKKKEIKKEISSKDAQVMYK
jgi:hypothetical protein